MRPAGKRREADKARQEKLQQDQKAKEQAAKELERAKDAFGRAEAMCKQQQWVSACTTRVLRSANRV